jgi:endoglucanase
MKFRNFLHLILMILIIAKIYPVKIDNNIRINQLGYLTNSPKYFIVANSNSTSFSIIDNKKETVFTGKLIDFGFYNESGEKLKIGDFTGFNQPGEYKIVIDKNSESYKFKIGDDIYDKVLNAAMKSYYYQRASMDLDRKYAGKWYRDKGHPDTNLMLHASTGKSGKYSSPGGWYDAGDYGKYIVNGGISVCTLLGLYELYPDVVKDDLNIPESGNKKSDILDEVKYEIDWMKTMQDIDGGVFFKIGPLRWPGFIQPKDDTAQRYVIGKSTTSTLNFCAVMAQAGRVFKNIDIIYANDCLDRAKRAWDWAIKNPRAAHPAETGGSGPYSDTSYDDEFYWAASELFISTGDNIYKKYITDNMNINRISKQATWAYVSNLGNFSLSVIANNLPEKQINTIKNGIINYSDKLIADINKSGYKIPMKENDFIWGSNGEICNYGVILCYAYKLTNDKKYLDGVIMILDYIFGKNATGYSFVTGYGSKTPMHIHHRPSGSDNIDEPVPGFLVGGPNKGRQDNQQYPSNAPAKSYVDRQDSYASNEICINWNAPLVFILGFLVANSEVYIK